MTAAPMELRRARTVASGHVAIVGFLFILPAFLFFLTYTFYPVLRSLWLSFTDEQFASSEAVRFVGLDNYVHALQDPNVTGGLVRALWFTLLFYPGAIILPLGLALHPRSRRPRADQRHLSGPALHPGDHPRAAHLRAVAVDVRTDDGAAQPAPGGSTPRPRPGSPVDRRPGHRDDLGRAHGVVVVTGSDDRVLPGRAAGDPPGPVRGGAHRRRLWSCAWSATSHCPS